MNKILEHLQINKTLRGCVTTKSSCKCSNSKTELKGCVQEAHK